VLSRLFRRCHLSRRGTQSSGVMWSSRVTPLVLSEESMSLPRARVRRLVPGATAIALIVDSSLPRSCPPLRPLRSIRLRASTSSRTCRSRCLPATTDANGPPGESRLPAHTVVDLLRGRRRRAGRRDRARPGRRHVHSRPADQRRGCDLRADRPAADRFTPFVLNAARCR